MNERRRRNRVDDPLWRETLTSAALVAVPLVLVLLATLLIQA